MCEWLSRAEWCDVRLVCRGGEFGAHRAVLSSVSGFLREVLLPCSENHSTALIMLPDFDLEDMFSVLYYIYNGEVIVQKSRIASFLDIIIALKIYIDQHLLDTGVSCNYEGKLSKISLCQEKNIPRLSISNPNLYSKAEHNNKQVSIKRQMTNTTKQELLSSSEDVEDIQGFYCNRPHRPYIENTVQKDRQKKPLLRGSFIGTDPRNSNGETASVTEILNETYQSTASDCLMNANGKAPDTTNCHSYHLKSDENERIAIPNQNRMLINPTSNNLNNTLQTNTVVSLSNQVTVLSSTLSSSLAYVEEKVKSENEDEVNSKRVRSVVSKSLICNKVMKSPWCPHPPLSYRPLRKDRRRISVEPIVHDSNSDSNNNCNLTEETFYTRSWDQKQNTDQNMQETTADVKPKVSPSSPSSSASGRFSCTECDKTFSQLRNYKYHMSVHRGTREFAATCPVCGKYFNDRGYLSSHMKIHRNRKEYKCQLCPKSFNQRVAYNMHVRIHTGVKPHVCEQCGKAFSRKMLLRQHQRTHSGERPYACTHCDKRFADRSNMTLHLRLHTGVKPFSCPLCSKSFTKKHHLKSHLNYHTGDKPYSCPKCNLGFTQSSNMRTHLKKCEANTILTQMTST